MFRRGLPSYPGIVPDDPQCVVLAGSSAPGRAIAALGIKTHLAANLQEAELLLARTGLHVLVSEARLWREAVQALAGRHPPVAVILLISEFDGALWVDAIEQGVYDVVRLPCPPGYLRHLIQGAHQYSLHYSKG